MSQDKYTDGHYEVVVSTDGGESYVRYASGIKGDVEAYEAFDHHTHMMRTAMRDFNHASSVIIELLSWDKVLESATLKSASATRPAFVRADRPQVTEDTRPTLTDLMADAARKIRGTK